MRIPETCALLPEKRIQYRTATTLDLLTVTAIDLDGRKTLGQVFDVSAGGIGFFVVSHADPGYPLGHVVWLCMRSPLLARPILAPAQARQIAECDVGRMYGLRFLDWQELLSRIPPQLARIFNRRREYRTRFDSEHPVEIVVAEGLDASSWEHVFHGLKAVLLDISATGLSFRVEADVGRQVEPHQSLLVSFALPNSTYRFTLWIQVLHCQPGPDGIACGALFDPELTEQFDEQRERLDLLL